MTWGYLSSYQPNLSLTVIIGLPLLDAIAKRQYTGFTARRLQVKLLEVYPQTLFPAWSNAYPLFLPLLKFRLMTCQQDVLCFFCSSLRPACQDQGQRRGRIVRHGFRRLRVITD